MIDQVYRKENDLSLREREAGDKRARGSEGL